MNTEIMLRDILSRTPLQVFNKCIESYNLHHIYQRQKVYLVNTYFSGNILKCAIAMADLFNQYQTEGQQIRAKELSDKMYWLLKEIRSAKKYRQPHADRVNEYNVMAAEHNQLTEGQKTLGKLYSSVIGISKFQPV